MEGLKGQRAFHTFTADEDKTVKSVLRGLPEMPTEDIADDLERQGLNVVKVTTMKSKTETPGGSRLYLVQFSPDTTAVTIRSIRYVCFTKATLIKYKRNNGHLTQCFRCQTYGHAAANCQRAPRCVKCVGNHTTSDCTKKERETPAKCAGCGGDHPANYKNCPRRMEYLQLTTKRHQQQRPAAIAPAVTIAPKSDFNLDWSKFPALPSTKPATQTPAPSPKPSPKTNTPPKQSTPEPTPEAMSTSDLRKMLLLLQEIRVKAGKCASKMEIALMLVEYLDVLF
jgi:hypothetical protein